MKIEKSYIEKLDFTEKDGLDDPNSMINHNIMTGGMTIKSMGIKGEDNMESLAHLGVPVGLIMSDYSVNIPHEGGYYEPDMDGGGSGGDKYNSIYRESNNFTEKKTATLEMNDGLLKLIQLYKKNKNKITKKNLLGSKSHKTTKKM